MAEIRRPLVLINGRRTVLPDGDTLPEDPTTLKSAAIGATVCSQTDSRLSNSREWTGSTVTQAEAEAGTATTRRAWTAQRVFQSIGAWWNASTAKTKLDGIASGATANATDAQLRDRSTHTGTQTASTISDSTTAGRALLTAADSAAQRTSLDLVKQTAISDFTPSRVALVDYIPRPSIDQIAGLAPTLDLDFERQVYRHYSPATGLREKPLSDIVTFTRASNATYFDAKGVMQTAGSNVPRLDFDPVTGVCRGLLIEEARTNLFLNSLLDGTNLSTQTVTVTAAAHTISFYGTGSITLSGAHSATITGTSDTTRTSLTFAPSAGSLVCTVSGTVKWANCSLGAFPTSFIPTAGATVTRAADVAVISGGAFGDIWNPNEQTALLFLDPKAITIYQSFLSAWADSNNRALSIDGHPGGYVTFGVRAQGTYIYSNENSGYITGRFAIASKRGDYGYSANGGGVVNNLSSLYPNAPSSLGIGFRAATNVIAESCNFLRLAIFPKRLPDATLQQLTAR
ncbi:MAG: hypothetical protein MZV65_38955 [Chromatiales bacterium]|nr:hypothetical protein [Chromatiales bacterium]